ncbi:MAG: translocation/assembly module TamB domain-containing protein [Thermodesulfobacteriota bacterium]
MKRLARSLVLLLLALIGLGGILLRVRQAWLPPLVVAFLQTEADRQGLSLTIDHLESVPWSGVTARALTLTSRQPDLPPLHLTLDRIEIRYNLATLLAGGDAFVQAVTVRATGLRGAIDLAATPAGTDHSEAQPPAWSLPALPDLQLEGVDLALSTTQGELAIHQGRLDLAPAPREGGIEALLKAEELELDLAPLAPAQLPLRARLVIGPGSVRLQELQLRGEDVPASARLFQPATGAGIGLEMALRLAGGSLSGEGVWAPSQLTAAFRGESLDLEKWRQLLRQPEIVPAGSLDAELDLRLDPRTPDQAAGLLRLSFQGQPAAPLQGLDLAGQLEAGTLRLDRLGISVLGSSLASDGLLLPLAPLLAGNWSGMLQGASGQLRGESSDLPAILALVGQPVPEPRGGFPAHRLLLAADLEQGRLAVTEGRLEADGVDLRLGTSGLLLPLAPPPAADTPLTASLKARITDLGRLATLFGLPPLAGELTADLRLTGQLGAPQGELDLAGRQLAVAGRPLGSLRLAASLAPAAIQVREIDLDNGRDRVQGRLRLDTARRALEDVDLTVRIQDLAAYTSDLLPPAWAVGGNLKAEIAGAGDEGSARGAFSAHIAGLTWQGQQLGDLAARGRVSPHALTLEALNVTRAGDRLDAQGSWNFTDELLEGGEAWLTIRDLAAWQGLWPGSWPALAGSLSARAAASGPWAKPHLQARATWQQPRLGSWLGEEALLEAAGPWTGLAVTAQLTAPRLGSLAMEGTLAAGARGQVKLDRLAWRGADWHFQLAAPAAIGWQDDQVTVADLQLTGSAGRLRLTGSVQPAGNSDLTLELAELASHGWLAAVIDRPFTFQGLSASLHLAGPAVRPYLHLAGDVQELGALEEGPPFAGRFDLVLDSSGLTVADFDWQATGGNRIRLAGRLPLSPWGAQPVAPGDLSVRGSIDLPDLNTLLAIVAPEAQTGGSLQGSLELSGSAAAPSGHLELTASGLSAPAGLPLRPPGPFAGRAVIVATADGLELTELQVTSPALTATGSGRWQGLPVLLELLRLRWPGGGGSVAGRLGLQAPDCSWAAAQLAGIRRLTGGLNAEMTLSGPAGQPSLTGLVRLSGGEVRPDLAIPAVRQLEATARLNGQEAVIELMTGELGGSPFAVSGAVRWPGPGPASWDLRLTGRHLLFYRDEGLKVRADADLALTGTLAKPELSGQLMLTDGRLVRNLDFLRLLRADGRPAGNGLLPLFSLTEPPARDLTFDLTIGSHAPFLIRSNMAAGSLRPSLRLQGTGELPILAGEVYVDATQVPLPAGRLLIETGVIRFAESQAEDASLSLSGRSRLRGYDVAAAIQGTLAEPVVTLSSNPPLPDDELLLLFLTGQLPQKGSQPAPRGSRNTAVMVYVGRSLLGQILGQESVEADESVLDRLDVEVGREMTREGEETIDAQFRLGESLVREGDTLYLTADKDVYDFYNVGLKLVFRFR